MRHVTSDLELRFGLLLAEGVHTALMYATCEPVKASYVTTRRGASHVLDRLEAEGVIVCVGEGAKRGKPNGGRLFVPPDWRPADPDALKRAQERGDGAALEKLVWIPSDGMPVPGGEPGNVSVEREDVVPGVAVEPLVESPNQPGVADAVAGSGGLRGVTASAGGAVAGAGRLGGHGRENTDPSGRVSVPVRPYAPPAGRASR